MSLRAQRSATLFPLLLVGLLAGLSYWLALASRVPTPTLDGKPRHDPDYIVTQFEVRRFDPQGQLQHTIVAAQMRHYPGDDSAIVSAPHITYHRDPPTSIMAHEARIDSDGEHVQLFGDVRLTRGSLDGKPEIVLTTSRLDVWPTTEVARSNEPVTIAQGLSEIRGSGLNADNKAAVYVLEGPVQGVFFRQGGAAALHPGAQKTTLPTAGKS